MKHHEQLLLVQLLLRMPGMQNYNTRTTLLAGIPNNTSLLRDEGNPYTDISLLISQASQLYLSSGVWALHLLLDNAQARVTETAYATDLAKLRQQLVAEEPHSTRKELPPPGIDRVQLTPPGEHTNEDAITLFYCYAPEDTEFCRELEKQLALMKRNNIIASWYPLNMQPGAIIQEEVSEALQAADIVVLLVSSDFMASDRLYEEQVKPALLQYAAGTTTIIPVIVRPTAFWEVSEFGHLPTLPRDKRPVTTWENPDAAFASIARDIRAMVEDMKRRKRAGN